MESDEESMRTGIDSWQVLPDDRGIDAGEVHVWRVALDRPTVDSQRFFEVLSADELHRAQRFHFERDRLRFARCRWAMRTIIGRLLGEDAGGLAFEYATNGKPALARAEAGRALEFNVSHSHGLALIAATWSRSLGIDLEQLREMAEFSNIVKRFFSPHERAAFFQIADDQKSEAFFRCWVRKEAILKVIGAGMSLPLDSFDVSVAPDEPARLLRMDAGGGMRGGPPGQPDRWSLVDLDPATGFVGALAVEGAGWRLVCRELSV